MPGHPVAVQAGAVDQRVGVDVACLGRDRRRRPSVAADPGDAAGVRRSAPCSRELGGEGPADRAVVHDAGALHAQRGDAGDLGLVLARPVRVDQLRRHARWPRRSRRACAAAAARPRPWPPRVCRTPAPARRPPRELGHGRVAGHCHPRLEAAGPVVQAAWMTPLLRPVWCAAQPASFSSTVTGQSGEREFPGRGESHDPPPMTTACLTPPSYQSRTRIRRGVRPRLARGPRAPGEWTVNRADTARPGPAGPAGSGIGTGETNRALR